MEKIRDEATDDGAYREEDGGADAEVEAETRATVGVEEAGDDARSVSSFQGSLRSWPSAWSWRAPWKLHPRR